ncbi:MAG: hypothetical protein ACXVEF_16580 [Polyangiales bacterium]
MMRSNGWWALALAMPLCTACTIVNNEKNDAGDGDVTTEDTGTPGDETTPVDGGDETATTDSGTEETSTETGVDPCGGIPADGKCVSSSKVTWCQTSTDDGELKVIEKTCAATEECKVAGGKADCVAKPGLCTPGAKECKSGTVLQTCNDSGAWVEETCPSTCQPSTIGAFCEAADPGGGTLPTKTFTGKLQYEYRGPNSATAPTAWSSTIKTAPGVRVLVVSYRGTDQIDATETDDAGNFSLKVPTTAASGDQITAWAVRANPGGLDAGVAFGVGIPKVADGNIAVDAVPEDGNQFWGWQWDLTTTTSGSTLTIKEDKGSGAMRVFDYLRYSYDATTFLFSGVTGKSMIVWLRYNTSWSCGACQWDVPSKVDAFDFQSQLFIPATAEDTAYWSDPVTAHELGHWVMASYGRSPQEGGKHCVGVPTMPGQAWSEGWATFFSSLVREDPLYYDKQKGSFFWVNIGTAKYDDGKSFPAPKAADGLLQQMDENLVASYSWQLTTPASAPGAKIADNKHFLEALASDRMKVAPFGRAYTRHKWAMTGCTKTSVTDLGNAAPMFADFLDALVCGGGVTASDVDAVTNPSSTFPYPSDMPVCK